MEDKMIISLGDPRGWEGEPWSAVLDLSEMCAAAGKRVHDQYYDTWYLDYPVKELRKALRLVRRFADIETLNRVRAWIAENYPKYIKEVV